MLGIDFATFSFGQPFYLWLLVGPGLLLLMWVWRLFRRRVSIRRYLSAQLVPIRERYATIGDLAFWLCVLIATSFCIAALAHPQATVTAVRRTGADLIILQDGSASMYVQDVIPDRWRRSVRFLRTLAETMTWKDGDRAALALFAHVASPQVRLTTDPNALFFFLDHLGEHSPFGLEAAPTWNTNIEEGVEWGLQLLDKDEELFGASKNPKAFVVISDGQAWSGDVAEALKAARSRGVPVNVVGIGTSMGGWIPGTPPDQGDPSMPTAIHAVLDRGSLREIARMGGGEYFEIGREPDRDIAQRIIKGVKSRAPVRQIDESHEELYWRFLLIAAVFLCLGTFALRDLTELAWQLAGAIVLVVGAAVVLL